MLNFLPKMTSVFGIQILLYTYCFAEPTQPPAAERVETVQPNPDEDSNVNMLVQTIQQEILNKQFARAPLLVVAAKQGNSKACNALGWMFDNGLGVKQDSTKALTWFESCAKTNALASYNAGVLYNEGRGVNKDVTLAIKYFRQAWSIGNTGFRVHVHQVPIRLARYYHLTKSFENAWKWAEKASDLNATHGKYLIARMLLEKSVPYVEDTRALNYLNTAVEEYSSQAAALLGWSYGTGRLSIKNMKLAYEYALIAGKIDPNVLGEAAQWAVTLTPLEKVKAEKAATSWFAAHQRPVPINFTGTLSGLEAQFKK